MPFVRDKRSAGCTVPAPQSWSMPFLGAPWGDRSPPGANLLGQTEVRAGTALSSASQQGKWQAARYAPVLLLALCPQQWYAEDTGGYGSSAAIIPLPARPGDLSCCSLSLPFLAECTHTDSAPGLKSTAITEALPSEGNIIPASPAPQQPSSPCHGRAG